MPVLHISEVGTTYPEEVTHDLGVDVERIVLAESPVGPMDGVVGGDESLLDMRVGSIIFFKGFARRILDLKERVAARRHSERGSGNQ